MGLRLLLCLTVGGAVALSLSTVADARPRCPTGGKTMIRTTEARVWDVNGANHSNGGLRGCSFTVGRVFSLGTRRLVPDDWMESAWSMSGSTIAYTATTTSGEFVVLVRNLRTGEVLHRAPATEDGAAGGDTPVLSMAVTRRGSFAWTATQDYVGPMAGGQPIDATEVHAIGSDGRNRVLQSGAGIVENFVHIIGHGTTVLWKEQTGEQRTAPLN